jgi:hypothetical protein
MKKEGKVLSFFLPLIIFLCSCVQEQSQQEVLESPVSGFDTIYVEDILYPYFKAAKPIYDSVFEHAKITLLPVSARRGMSLLFSDSTNCVILSRDYLHDEDSIVKSLNMQFKKIEIAKDGLVFYVNNRISLDTLNKQQLDEYLHGSSINSVQKFVKLEESLVVPSMQSSEYASLLHYFSKKDTPLPISKKVIENRDSLRSYVLKNDVIGIGMMSHILKDSALKPIRIGYIDSSNKRIPPQIVHPGFIVQNMYPFIVPIFAFMKSDQKSLAWGFATFMEKDPTVQKILLKEGIVPSHARYNLIRED